MVEKLKDLWYTVLGKGFSLFAQVMVKVQPIWDKYKIVISIVLGIAIGLLLGTGPLAPVWENASPGSLREDYRAHYLVYAGEHLIQTGDAQAVARILGLDLPKNKQIPWTHQGDTLEKHLNMARDNAQKYQLSSDKEYILGVLQERIGEVQASVALEEQAAGSGFPLQRLALIFVVLLLVLGAIAALWFLVINKKPPAAEAETYETIAVGEPTGAPGEAQIAGEPPVKSFTTTYVLGDDYFDPSFSIEIGPDFLGECGIGISETIGAGDPKKVTAFEAWLFDKSDIRTVTSVLASDFAANDPDLRAKLEPKGDIQALEAGAEIMLETTALRVQAVVKELEYAQGNLPNNSFVQKISFELRAWVKATDADAEPEI